MSALPLAGEDHPHRSDRSPGAASAPRRPGETYARPELALPARRSLAIASAEAEVPIDVAATLICEAALLLERLEARRVRCPVALLDRAAGRSRVTRALDPASADYLRALGCRSWRRHRGEIELPVRLLARAGARLDERLERSELLEPAIRWEIGALLAARSMGTWGTEVALGAATGLGSAGQRPTSR